MADGLLQFLAWELDDEEESLIAAAHLAYFYYHQAVNLSENDEKKLLIRKNQVVLTDTFADYFRHTVAMCYRGNNHEVTQEGFVNSLRIADQRTQWLVYLHIRQAAELNPNLANDEYLIAAEGRLAHEGFDSGVLDEATLLHRVLVGYIAKKIQLSDFRF
jgi:hypothetical protein